MNEVLAVALGGTQPQKGTPQRFISPYTLGCGCFLGYDLPFPELWVLVDI